VIAVLLSLRKGRFFPLSDHETFSLLDAYIQQLIAESTPEHTVWNVEKIRQGKPASWNYIDGCMMTALLALHEITGEQKYFDFVDSFIDSFISEDGQIRTYSPEKHVLDDINEGRVLFDLYQATGRQKYRLAADLLHEALLHQPRTFEGSWWHKDIYPDQVWLDGIYMAQPFSALYEKYFGAGDYSDIRHQVLLVRDHMRDPETGLYYHGYDASRRAFWCNPETGLSQSFWLRAIGWFSVALADLCEILPSGEAVPLQDVFKQLMSDLLPFADPETGMYYQVVNHPEVSGNYLETSGSSMVAYAMLKGARLGLLDDSFMNQGRKTFEGMIHRCLSFENGRMNLRQICLVAGLGPEKDRRRDGTIAYYLSEPVVENDAKGVAPLLLCYTEMKRLH